MVDKEEPKELTEDEKAEYEARQAMRRAMRSGGIVFSMAFFVGIVFMSTLTSVVARGMTQGAMLAPIGIYLLLGLALTRRGRWGLSAFCLLGLVLHLTVIQESAKTLAMKRETRTKVALQRLRASVAAFKTEKGRVPNSLSEMKETSISPLICKFGRPRVLEITPSQRNNTGTWVYDLTNGSVSVDCEMRESTGKRWSEL